MVFHLRRIVLPLMVAVAVLVLTAGCRPTYPKEDIIGIIGREVQKDWGITPDRILIKDDYLGLIYREDTLWNTEGKLRPEVGLNVANIERTVERVLVSSDAGVTTFSVTVAGADSANNLRFERSLDMIRQKRAGEISWQDTFDADNNTAVPCWTWEPFGEPYYYFENSSPGDLSAYLQNQIQSKYRLKSKVRIEDGTLAVLFRLPRLWEGNELLPESEQLEYSVLAVASTAVLKSDLPIGQVSVTMGGNDSQENLTIVDALETVRSQVTGAIDMEAHKAALIRSRSPFWLWHTYGPAGWYTTGELQARILEAFGRTLKWKPDIGQTGDSLSLSLRTVSDDPAVLLTGETLHNFASALLSVYDAILLSDTDTRSLSVSFTSNGTAQSIYFCTSTDVMKEQKTAGMTADSLAEHIERDLSATCTL